MNLTTRSISALALGLTALAVASSAAEFDYEVPAPGSYQLPVVKAAADGEVIDAAGKTIRLRDLVRGRVSVLSFIYTRCGDAKACPYATGVLKQLHAQSAGDPVLGGGLRLISMSFDPENDTPARLAEYAAIAQSDAPAAEWRFVTTAAAGKLQPILDAYGQAVNRKENANDPAGPLNHTLRVFLIDAEGRIRNIYSTGTLDARLVLADIRTLLMEAPLTPAQAARKPGEICTVAFKVETAARVTDITDRENHRPEGIALLDVRNDNTRATPSERAGIIVGIPGAILSRFGAGNLDESASRFEGRRVAVTGRIEVEPHAYGHDNAGQSLSRVKVRVADPLQIRIE